MSYVACKVQVLLWCDHKYVFQSDSNKIQTHNHLVRKQTLNHVAKLASLQT